MADPRIASAREEGKMNRLFPILHGGDAAAGVPSSTSSADRSHHNEAWESLWADGSFLPWERGMPHPALHDALIDRKDILGDALHEPGSTSKLSARRKALVPGCGKAHDVYQLASFGYDVLGIDVSNTAIASAAELEAKIRSGKTVVEGAPVGVGYNVKDEEVGQGEAKVEICDFFNMEGKYDLIFDHTFLSALPPSLRPQWAESMSRLLKPSGRLICAEFPTQKPTDSGGPPWALPPQVYLAHLHCPGKSVQYDRQGKVAAEDAAVPPEKGGLERIAWWSPQRSHEAGKGTDMVSVWAHTHKD